MRILVVDDDGSIRAFFREFLTMERHDVFIASNGEEARKMIERYKKDLDCIITDLRMPFIYGWEINKNEGIEIVSFARLVIGKGIRIILMSGDLTDIDARFAQAAGADFIISKPFQVAELKTILNSVKKNN